MDRETIFYIGTFATLAYIGINIWRQISKQNEYNNCINSTTFEYNLAKDNRNEAKKNALNKITIAYGKNMAQTVADGKFHVGMATHLLLMSKGRPNDIKSSVYKDDYFEKWYYGEYVNRLGNYKYTLEISLENDVVVGYKNLN